MGKLKITLELEYLALNAVRNNFYLALKQSDRKRLFRKSIRIFDMLEKKNVQLRTMIIQSDSKAFKKLINTIYKELIYRDPVLSIVSVFNETLPEDRDTRKWLQDNFLDDRVLAILDDYLMGDVHLEQKSNRLSIPIGYLTVGEVLQRIADDYFHFSMIDRIKDSGAEESIQELRKRSLYKTDAEIIHDYAPFFKIRIGSNQCVFEVFSKEDFEALIYRKNNTVCRTLSGIFDNILCFVIQKVHESAQERYDFFGNNAESSDFNFIVQYGSEMKAIPLQMLPKWHRQIVKQAKRYKLTTVDHIIVEDEEKNKSKKKYKEEEIQEATAHFFNGILSWREANGPATPCLNVGIKQGLGAAFDGQATEVLKWERRKMVRSELNRDLPNTDQSDIENLLKKEFKEKILKESLDSLGGSLQDKKYEDEEFGDFIEDKESLSPIEKAELIELEKAMAEFISALEKSVDRKIAHGLLHGYQQNDIAQFLGISPAAVNKRIKTWRHKISPKLARQLKDFLPL